MPIIKNKPFRNDFGTVQCRLQLLKDAKRKFNTIYKSDFFLEIFQLYQ